MPLLQIFQKPSALPTFRRCIGSLRCSCLLPLQPARLALHTTTAPRAMEGDLPHLDDVEQLTPLVTRVLGANPGKV